MRGACWPGCEGRGGLSGGLDWSVMTKHTHLTRLFNSQHIIHVMCINGGVHAISKVCTQHFITQLHLWKVRCGHISSFYAHQAPTTICTIPSQLIYEHHLYFIQLNYMINYYRPGAIYARIIIIYTQLTSTQIYYWAEGPPLVLPTNFTVAFYQPTLHSTNQLYML